MCNFFTPPRRIEYLDALRGFTMLLVVMSHVSNFCLESVYRIFTFHSVLSEFRMPLFFFVSGFVFYKNIYWKWSDIVLFLKKKIPVQIITPAVFMCIYLHIQEIPFLDAVHMESKAGYWFTFMLFEYFCFYILFSLFLQFFRLWKYRNLAIGLVALGCYILTSPAILEVLALSKTIRGMLGIGYWPFFLFFWLGTCVKDRFSQFQNLLDGKWIVPLSVALFILLNISPSLCPIHTLRIMLCQLAGVVVVFAFFRHYQQSFTKQTKLGVTLQYIGKRTLDIYLLHYFFLPTHLNEAFPLFSHISLPAIEIVVSLLIAGCVIILCLIVSNALRINPDMAHWMWGVKRMPK